MERPKEAFIPEVRHAPYPRKSELPCRRVNGEENLTFLPHGKKSAAPEDLKAEASKREKKSLSGGPDLGGDIAAQCPQGGQPLAKP